MYTDRIKIIELQLASLNIFHVTLLNRKMLSTNKVVENCTNERICLKRITTDLQVFDAKFPMRLTLTKVKFYFDNTLSKNICQKALSQ